MIYYTKKWNDFIYRNYYDYINDKNYSHYYKFFDENNKEDILYSEEVLIQEFEKYYNEKLKYKNNYDTLKLQFNNIQEVELMSYQEEFDNYKKKLELYSNKLREEFIVIFKNNDKFSVDEIDFRIIALNRNRIKLKQIYLKLNVTNELNGFLYGYYTYLENKKYKYDYDILDKVSFHDGIIENIYFFEDNKKMYGKIFFEDGFEPDKKWCIKFYDVEILNKDFEDYKNIVDYEYGNYEDYKYYLRLDEHEFIAEKIEILEI